MDQNSTRLANLEKGKDTQFKTGEQQVEIARRGGIASGEAKRARKTIRAELEALLATHPVNDKGEVSPNSYQTAMIAALMKKALKGDTKAFELIRDTIGEKPAERIALAQIDQETIDRVEELVREHDA